MNIKLIVVGPLGVNCALIYDDKKEATIIDPGWEAEKISAVIDREGLTPTQILCTHGHFDHVSAVTDIKEKYSIPMYIHKIDEEWLPKAAASAAYFGFDNIRIASADGYLDDGQIIDANGAEIKVIHTPGHSFGSLSFYLEKYSLLFSGDTLFRNSIGRTDFEGSDYATIEKSILEKLYTLPDETYVIPGHGAATTIGYEKLNNDAIRQG